MFALVIVRACRVLRHPRPSWLPQPSYEFWWLAANNVV
uniref:Uncharacterized protein n=1 Tax=Triticum urartu TaxID=4572 RepID=A0A8R7TIM1_TRIUA